MLVHRRVTPSSKFAGTHLYTWVERGTMRVKCLTQEHNAVPRPGLEPGPFDSESSVLTIRPPRLPVSRVKKMQNGVYEKPERPDDKQSRKTTRIHCYRCGSSGYLGRGPKCSARGQTCRDCKGKDHFASACQITPKKPGVNQLQEKSKLIMLSESLI